jgi:hypothetical protein
MHFRVQNEVLERIPAGFQTLALGRTKLISNITFSERSFGFFVLHFGQQNMIGCIDADDDADRFNQMQFKITEAFKNSNIGDVITLIHDYSESKFSFNDLFKDEKRKILKMIMEKSFPPVDTVIKDYYEDNYQLMIGMLQSNIAIPEAWRSITQFVINRELSAFFLNGKFNVRKLKYLVKEFDRWNVLLTDKPALSLAAGERIFYELQKAARGEIGLEQIQGLIEVIEALHKLNVNPELWKTQNLYYHITKGYRSGEWVYVNEAWKNCHERLGVVLNMAMD